MSYATNDSDRINRIGWGLGAFAALFGFAVLVSSPWLMPALLPAVGGGFALNPTFLPVGGLIVGGLWVLNAMLFAIVFADGHWRTLTRQLDITLNAVWLVAMAWLVIGPQIFLSPATDQAAKFWIAVVLAIVAVSMVPKVRRVVRQ